MLNNASDLYNNELTSDFKKVYEIEPKDDKSGSWKQKYIPKNFKALDYHPVKPKAESSSDENRSDIKQPMQLKRLKLNEIPKSSRIKLTKKDFHSLIKNAVNNLDNGYYKTIAGSKKYDLKNAEKFLLEITNKKVTESEAREMYYNLIKSDIVPLEKSASRSKDKRNIILNILNNLESVFTGFYFHYDDKPESEESNAEITKLRRQRFDEIAKKENMVTSELFKSYFEYSGLSDMYKTLNEAKTTEEKVSSKYNRK